MPEGFGDTEGVSSNQTQRQNDARVNFILGLVQLETPLPKSLPALSDYRTVIHYGRFSSGGQADGTSKARQHQRVDEWAAANGITFTDRLFDEGLSGYKGTHRKQGDFGLLLHRATNNELDLPALVVLAEGDRAGREDVDVQIESLVLGLLRSGVDLFVVNNGLHLNLEIYRRDVGVQVVLQTMLHAANQYSRLLSERGLYAHEKGRQQIMKGKPARKGWAPHWIDFDDANQQWRLNDRAATIRHLLDLASDYGSCVVARKLNEAGHTTARGKRWTTGTVEHVINTPAVAGGRPTRRRDADAIAWDYFPALLTRDAWEALLQRRKARDGAAHKGNQQAMNYIAQGLTQCTCGAAIGARIASYRKQGETLHRRYIKCRATRIGACDQVAVRLQDIHAHLLTRLALSDMATLFPADQESAIDVARQVKDDCIAARDKAAGDVDFAQDMINSAIEQRDTAKADRWDQRHQQALSALSKAKLSLRDADVALASLTADDALQSAVELRDKVRQLLGQFAAVKDDADHHALVESRQVINALLKRLDMKVVVDANARRCGLTVKGGEMQWQPLTPFDHEALRRGWTEKQVVEIKDATPDEIKAIQKLIGAGGSTDGVAAVESPLTEGGEPWLVRVVEEPATNSQ